MIRIELSGIPPSSNHAYFNLPSGGRTLTKTGLKYKNETKTFIAQNHPMAMTYFKPNMEYTIFMQFVVLKEDFYNMTYGKKNGAKTLIKRLDISNRVKLLEDAFKDATAIDDSCTTCMVTRKVPGDKERTIIMAWRTKDDPDPFVPIIEQLL